MKMSRNIILVAGFLCFCCKKEQISVTSKDTNTNIDSITNVNNVVNAKKTLQRQDTLFLDRKNFSTLLKKIKDVKHTKNEHGDWMTNKPLSFYEKLFDLSRDSISVSTTGYTYKQNCKFYLHTLSHVNDTISMMPYIKNAVGKKTKGYMKVRFLFFAMKDSLKANFIDVPPNYGYSREDNELIEKIIDRMDIVTMYCKYSDPCTLKDFQK